MIARDRYGPLRYQLSRRANKSAQEGFHVDSALFEKAVVAIESLVIECESLRKRIRECGSCASGTPDGVEGTTEDSEQ
jgi:hypothetical protein